MRFDPITLRLFVAICQSGSISGGAAQVHLALGAASRRIAQLESDAGTALFERHARGVRLTPAGRAMLHHARLLSDGMDRLKAEMSEYAGGIKGHVRMFANRSSVVQFLPHPLRQFLDRYPGLRVELQEHPSHSVLHALQEGLTDIGIFDASSLPDGMAGLEYHPYRQDRLALLVPADHAFAARRSLWFDEALDEDFIGLRSGTALHDITTAHARQAEKSLRIRIQVFGFDSMCRMVQARVGVGVAPRQAVLPQARMLGMRTIPLRDAWASRQHCLGYRQSTLPQPARLLADFLLGTG
ncbi:MAG: LysR family transcriptional regulator [Pigmentiphaga sp.]|nr:LysR family transcriptional regulator [Pigmentiphaga sp.]